MRLALSAGTSREVAHDSTDGQPPRRCNIIRMSCLLPVENCAQGKHNGPVLKSTSCRLP